MQVEYAFLADAAQTASDQKLYVLGGGIDRIFTPAFPSAHPYMSLVIKLKVHPTECERSHQLEIELWNVDGEKQDFRVSGEFVPERRSDGRATFLQLVLNLFALTFPKPGDYEFHVIVDGQHLKEVALFLEEVGAEPKTPAS